MNVAHRTNAERFEKQNLILEQALAQKTEEQKEQNKALHILQDEVLASQIQLNLLEQRADNLQLENDTLVQRLVDKAAADADKMNDANAFLERYVFYLQQLKVDMVSYKLPFSGPVPRRLLLQLCSN